MDDCSSFLVYTWNVFIRAEHGSEPCPCALWPQQVWLQPHTECVLGMCLASSSSAMCAGRRTGGLAEGYQTLLKATSIFHTTWRRRELSSSQLSVVPGRHFCAADTTNCKYRTAGHSLPSQGPRGQSHSFCCSVGHRTVMEKSATRTVIDVTERISKDTKHLCLDSWIGAGTSTHQSHKHHLHLCVYRMFQSFSIAMCQRMALGDTFTSFGTAA